MHKKVIAIILALATLAMFMPVLAAGAAAPGEAPTYELPARQTDAGGVFAIGSEQDVLSGVFPPLGGELQVELEDGAAGDGDMVKRATPTIRIVDPFIDEKLIKGNKKKVIVEYSGLDLNTCRFSACLSKLVKGPQELTGSNLVYDFATGGAVFHAGPNRGEILLDTANVSNGTYYLWVMFSDSASNTTGYNRIPINILSTTAFGWYEQSNGKWSFMETDGRTWVTGTFRQIVYNGNMEYYYFDNSGYMVTGWQTIGDKRYYFGSEGVMKRNSWVTVDGKQYFMDENGTAASEGWVAAGGRRYYLSGGNPVKGLQTLVGVQYIFEDDGALATGGKATFGGKTYFANDDGSVFTGWQGKNYYLPEMAAGGFYSIDGRRYGFDDKGEVCENGLAVIGGDYYLFSAFNTLTGYHTVDGKNMYFIESGDNMGKRAKGPTYVNGGYLFFSDEGVRDDGSGERQVGGRYYYIIGGVPQSGEHGGRLYGSDFAAVHGFQDGVFYEHGQKQASKWVTDLDDKMYLLDAEGKARKGWVQAAGKWYYLLPDTGELVLDQWAQVSGRWYFLKSDGSMATGWHKVGSSWYYFSTSGVMKVGWVQDGGSWYYMHANGKMATGWVKVGSAWYYMHGSGKMATGWVKVGSSWYYLKASGAMATGWEKLGGKWYYLNPSTGAMLTGTHTIGGKRYTFSSSGAMN